MTFLPSNYEILRLVAFGVITATSTAAWTFTAPSATAITTTIAGAASQTANLTEWKNSSGTVLAYMTAAGALKSRRNITTRTTAVLLASTTHDLVRFTASSDVTLNNATSSGIRYTIKSSGASTRVRIVCTGTDTIDGEPTLTLLGWDSVEVVDVASGKWEVV